MGSTEHGKCSLQKAVISLLCVSESGYKLFELK